MYFKEVKIENLKKLDPFTKIGKEWILITAGDEKNFNMMTASWGGMGVIWDKNVAFSFVRPQRYTFKLLEKHEFYTLSFFESRYREVLNFCGRTSGKDINKIEKTGLKPVLNDSAPYFEQAEMVLVCKKIYSQFLDPSCFLDESINGKYYKNNDYQKMFIGEIAKCLIKNQIM